MAEETNGLSSSELAREQSEAVAAKNIAVIGDGPSFYQNMAYGDSVAHQRAMFQIREAAVGKIVEALIHTSPSEGAIDVAAIGQLMKALQLTPPQTPPAT